MTLNERIARFVTLLLRELAETQQGLADRLGVTQTTLKRYQDGTSLPSLENMLCISELSGVSINDIATRDDITIQPKEPHQSRVLTKRSGAGAPLSPAQWEKLKTLVDEIVRVHQETMEKPHTYGSIWHHLCRKLGIEDRADITQDLFESAEAHLFQTLIRLKGRDGEERPADLIEEQIKAIYALARKNLRLTRGGTDTFVEFKFGKHSIRDLSQAELAKLLEIVSKKKSRRRRTDGDGR